MLKSRGVVLTIVYCQISIIARCEYAAGRQSACILLDRTCHHTTKDNGMYTNAFTRGKQSDYFPDTSLFIRCQWPLFIPALAFSSVSAVILP